MINPNQRIIIIPGLFSSFFNRKAFFLKLADNLRRFNLPSEVFSIDWFSTKKDFSQYLGELSKRIDYLAKTNNPVSLIGTSAGGSLAFNAFNQVTSKVNKLVLVCSPLDNKNSVRLKIGGAVSKIFRDSLIMSQKQKNLLTKSQKNRLLLVIPYFDELVPIKIMRLVKAKTMRIRTMEHFISINTALTKNFNQIYKHLTE